jgi:hypothetical protein
MIKELAKSLEATCPRCGRRTGWVVNTYKDALRSAESFSFQCNCGTEFTAERDHVHCGVVTASARSSA